jgi:16S rRNA (cytidine1402-2'-O)-methyltransferase
LVDGHALPDNSKIDSKTGGNVTQSPSSPSSLIVSQSAQDTFPALSIQPAKLAPGLYVVSTPIGNLRDITLRALDTLASADHILAEDTRQSRKLLQAYGLKASLTAYHDHNAAKRVPNLVNLINEGASVALISDAGTPLVSDPGYKLARAAIDEGLDVFAIPGASAVLTGLVSSGLASDKFMFAGFLPPKSGARQTALSDLMSVPASLIFFESAGRLSATLTDILAVLGDRPAAIARELTKHYEEILRGSVSELLTQLGADKLRGEIVLLIGPPAVQERWDLGSIDAALRKRIPDLGVKKASEEIAAISGHAKRDIYKRALDVKDG